MKIKFSSTAAFLALILLLGCKSIVSTGVVVSETEDEPTVIVLSGPTFTKIPAQTSTLAPTSTSKPTKTQTITPSPTNSRTPSPSPSLPSECGVVILGTPGTQNQSDDSSPPVLIQGTAVLCINRSLFTDDYSAIVPYREAMFDLDTGNFDIESSDIAYNQSGTMNFNAVFPVNGAEAEIWTFNVEGNQLVEPIQPTYDQCKQQYIYPNRWDNEPVYLCVITNEGHVSRVKIEEFMSIPTIPSVEISFMTWSDVVAKP